MGKVAVIGSSTLLYLWYKHMKFKQRQNISELLIRLFSASSNSIIFRKISIEKVEIL